MGASDDEPDAFNPGEKEELQEEERAFAGGTTMKEQLRLLQLEEPQCVFIARHVNTIGFNSAAVVKEYFGQFGEVKDVHVSHSRAKSARVKGDDTADCKKRPAAVAFVVMEFVDDALKALSTEEHQVTAPDGKVHKILAQSWQRQQANPRPKSTKRVHEEIEPKQKQPAQKQQKRTDTRDGKGGSKGDTRDSKGGGKGGKGQRARNVPTDGPLSMEELNSLDACGNSMPSWLRHG